MLHCPGQAGSQKCPRPLSVYVDMMHQLNVIHSCEYCMTMPESSSTTAPAGRQQLKRAGAGDRRHVITFSDMICKCALGVHRENCRAGTAVQVCYLCCSCPQVFSQCSRQSSSAHELHTAINQVSLPVPVPVPVSHPLHVNSAVSISHLPCIL